jgi:hypothetical protein
MLRWAVATLRERIGMKKHATPLLFLLLLVACGSKRCTSSSDPSDAQSIADDDDDEDASTPASRRADRAAKREARAKAKAEAKLRRALDAAGGSVQIAPNSPDTTNETNQQQDAGGIYSFGDPNYKEELNCEKLDDVDALKLAYLPGGTRAAAEGLAQVRYSMGLPFLKVQDDTQLKAWFKGAPDTFEGVASRFDAAVHEGSHIWGFKKFNPAKQIYPVRGDLNIETKRLTNFHRSEIVKRHVDAASDTYVKIYLEGQSGAQGFNTLLDEYNAYTHSLASRYCTRDLLAPNLRTSAIDGILTMMYYVETYLEIARTEHRADYNAILADPGHRKLILTVWDRAEYWLRKSAGVRALGIDPEKLTQRVYDPKRLEEITLVRSPSSPDAGR